MDVGNLHNTHCRHGSGSIFSHRDLAIIETTALLGHTSRPVVVTKAVALLPIEHPWDTLFDSLTQFSDDFMAARQQLETQTRDDAFG